MCNATPPCRAARNRAPFLCLDETGIRADTHFKRRGARTCKPPAVALPSPSGGGFFILMIGSSGFNHLIRTRTNGPAGGFP